MSPIIAWFLLGGILFAADKMQTKFNLIYGVYSALMIGIFLIVGIMKVPEPGAPDYPLYNYYIAGQTIVFFLGCLIWMFVLRDAAPKSKLGSKAKEFYQGIIGKTVVISSGGINAVSGGEVILDGNIMQAKLDPESGLTSVKAGSKMQIKAVVGDTLVLIADDDD